MIYFTDIADGAGLSAAAQHGDLYGQFAWGDYDGDGHLDFYITKDGSPNLLYKNDGVGYFTDVAAEVGLDHNGSGIVRGLISMPMGISTFLW